MSDVNKVVLAYSGGLDTSVILKWLQETYACMAAGVTDTLRDMVWIVSLIDARAPKPGRRGSYKKTISN